MSATGWDVNWSMPHAPTVGTAPPNSVIPAGFLGVVDVGCARGDSQPEVVARLEYPEPSVVDESQAGETGFRAVQGDTAITCVDWQAFHSWQDDDPAFTGVITVLDDRGGQQTMANWSCPTDAAADTSLGNTGWQRVGPWNSDHNGRRSAPVCRPPDYRPARRTS